VLSQMTGDPYGEPALSELRAGKEMVEEGLGNPVAFAHTVIDLYVQATGDFLYGTGEVSRGSYNLALSSAAVARSACEYASIAWWLAEPGIPIDSRIARTARLVITTYNEGKSTLDPSERDQYEADNAVGVSWAQRNLSAKEKLPGPTERFKMMNPAQRAEALFSPLDACPWRPSLNGTICQLEDRWSERRAERTMVANSLGLLPRPQLGSKT
jgi:hypothetical protein